jgi:hypothetical protein
MAKTAVAAKTIVAQTAVRLKRGKQTTLKTLW